ncbi:recombination mediator RecR [Thiohalorhabdus methylotrophus]|uniref:Recombination protein RecR n=1 Tax=Thiohalorhabdus methylotrophus TaxID=3242694 RepID=A0ABV4TVV8_9GAMM
MSERVPALDTLTEALQRLPGVGPKSARRMVFHLLERDREGGQALARALDRALEEVGHCRRCNNLTDSELCPICASPRRDQSFLCVVESPSDIPAVEQAASFNGTYFVLMGRLSPLDGIGPEDLAFEGLDQRIAEGVTEVVVATNATVEGEATAHYIYDRLEPQGVRVTRLAHGVPLGGELEFVDGSTIDQALMRRYSLEEG